MPGGERLQCCSEGFEVLTVLVSVICPAEYGIELLQKNFLRESLCIGRGNERNQTTLVALVVHQHRLAVTCLTKLASFVAVGHGNLQSELGGIDSSAVERNASLHQRAEHGEEATTWAGNR